MATKTATATKGKQETPLADNEKESPIKDNGVTKAKALDFDWGKLPEPEKREKLTASPSITEEEIPQRIRDLVEAALPADEYFAITLPDENVRAAFVQFMRSYCFVRKAGRLTSRITVKEAEVRYSVTVFKEREKKAETTNGKK